MIHISTSHHDVDSFVDSVIRVPLSCHVSNRQCVALTNRFRYDLHTCFVNSFTTFACEIFAPTDTRLFNESSIICTSFMISGRTMPSPTIVCTVVMVMCQGTRKSRTCTHSLNEPLLAACIVETLNNRIASFTSSSLACTTSNALSREPSTALVCQLTSTRSDILASDSAIRVMASSWRTVMGTVASFSWVRWRMSLRMRT